MRFHVLIGDFAAEELEQAYQYVRRYSPHQATLLRDATLDAAESLEFSPQRCPLAPENGAHGLELRQLLSGSYRLIFAIQDDLVVVMRIRHTARAPMTPDELLPSDEN